MSTDTEVEVAAPEKSARWEDFVDVFLSPADLYARRRDESWTIPFLLFCAISIALYYVFLPIGGLIWEAAMLENAPPNADAAQIQQSAQFMKYLGGVFVPIGYGFMIAFMALGMKLASSVLEPGARWRQAFLIATYASYVGLIQQVLTTIAVYVKSRSGTITMADASFGLLRFMPDADPVTKAMIGRVDLFAFWSLILCAIGLSVIVGMSRGKALATAAIAWLLVALPGVIGGLLQGGRS
jgi:hypothetical protein